MKRPFYYSNAVRKIVYKWPGRKTFGIYSFLPLFFLLGAALEFSMINWQVGQVNFYKVYKRREAEKLAKTALEKERLKELTMPAGVPWPTYIRFTIAALLSMFAGSQVVHSIYRPLEDLNDIIEQEKEKLKKDKMK